MEARIQITDRAGAADLVVMTPSDTKTFPDFFPLNTNNSYVEVGFSAVGNSQVVVYKNGSPFFSDAVALSVTDDENHVCICSNTRRNLYLEAPRPFLAVPHVSRAGLSALLSMVWL